MGDGEELFQNHNMVLKQNLALGLAGGWQNEDSPAQNLGKGKKPTQQP